MTLFLILFATILIGPFVMSTGEWSIHKYAMHTGWWFLTFPFNAHDQTHHPMFSGKKYLLKDRPGEEIEEASGKIMMAKWAFAVVIPVGTLPFMLVASPFALFFDWWAPAFVIVSIGAFYATLNYIIYEIIHLRFHNPRGWRIEKWPVIQWLNEQHQGHHNDSETNLNVVFPFADWLFGTLRTRAQATS
ncbi:MAG: hypothetical protein Q8R25_01380 [bacterium]|nr:hypothetical protein [bacterium]